MKISRYEVKDNITKDIRGLMGAFAFYSRKGSTFLSIAKLLIGLPVPDESYYEVEDDDSVKILSYFTENGESEFKNFIEKSIGFLKEAEKDNITVIRKEFTINSLDIIKYQDDFQVLINENSI